MGCRQGPLFEFLKDMHFCVRDGRSTIFVFCSSYNISIINVYACMHVLSVLPSSPSSPSFPPSFHSFLPSSLSFLPVFPSSQGLTQRLPHLCFVQVSFFKSAIFLTKIDTFSSNQLCFLTYFLNFELFQL